MKDRPGKYVRDHYGVPAFIGRPVVHTYGDVPRHGKITGFDGKYLLIKFDDETRHVRELFHPTWEMRYPLDHDGEPLEWDE